MNLEFKTAAVDKGRQEENADDVLDFTIRGLDAEESKHTYTMHRPTTGQLGLFAGTTGDASSGQDKIQALFSLLRGTFEPDDYRHLTARLNNRTSGVEIDDVMDIVMDLVKEFTAFPTQPSSDSSPSPTSTGPSSMESAPVPASTRSISRRIDSQA